MIRTLKMSDNGSKIIGRGTERLTNEHTPLVNYEYELDAIKSSDDPHSLDDPHSSDDLHSTEGLEIKSYKRRWWLLIVYMLTGLTKGQVFNSWPPIAYSASVAFGWSISEIAQIPAATDVGCFTLAIPMMYMVQTRGLRVGVLLAISMIISGVGIIVINIHTSHIIWLQYIGYYMLGCASAILMSSSSLFAATWFPVHERTTTTALCSMAINLGLAFGSITGPYFVHGEIIDESTQGKTNLTAEYTNATTNGIFNLVYLDAGLAGMCFLLITSYFPAKPPKPPSKSQIKTREDFGQGLKHLIKSPQFMLLNLSMNLATNTNITWLSLAAINYRPLGIDQVTAGWIGFVGIGSCFGGSVVFSRIADYYFRQTKAIAKIAIVCAIILQVILACIQQKYIVFDSYASLTGTIFTLVCLSSALVYGTFPIYFELGCEIAFPVSEGLAGCLLTIGGYIIAFCYYLLLTIPPLAEDTHWMTWSLLACTILTLVTLCQIKDNYSRLDEELSSDTNEASGNTLN